MRTIKALRAVAAVSAVMIAGACNSLDAPDQNANTLSGLTSSPSRAAIVTATQGLLAGVRGAGPCTGLCAYLGREGFNLDPSNPQNVSTTYIVGADFSAWTTPYQNNKQADIVIQGLTTVTGMTAAEKEGVAGIAQTVKAIDLMFTIQTTDQTGAVLEVPALPTSPVPPLATAAQAYATILARLDSANTHLAAAGTSFPISFPAGYTGFTTPANFIKFNKAIRARISVYTGNYAAALTDLGVSFVNPTTSTVTALSLAQLTTGIYNTYSTTSGDATNGVYDATDRQRYAHTGYATDAQLQAGATAGDTTKRDARFLRKIGPVRATSGAGIVGGLDRYGFHINWSFRVYNGLADPIPLIRNEELILLRAEANLACTTTGQGVPVTCGGNAAARLAALLDINTVRTSSGGLSPLPDEASITAPALTGDRLLDELLYNKRYSMVWEGGYRWLDARKYGILAKLPKDQAGHLVFPYSPLTATECAQRSITANTGICAPPAGL